jgi:type I restriction enzyme S subunit
MKRSSIDNASMWVSSSAVDDGRTGYVPENAVLMVVRSGILRRKIPVGVTTRPVAFNQDLKGYVFRSDEMLSAYVAALIASNDHELLTLWRKYGATVESLEQPWVDNTLLPLPPLDEQRAIVAFLDGMDARITRFIAARRKMIALLEEQKQAVINQAVTRGLDPDVPLKESGVDWLGEIPAHWKLRANRTLFKLKKRLVGEQSDDYILLSLTLRGVIKRDMENPEGKFPSSFDTYQEVKPGDLVFCLFDIEETPRCIGLSPFSGMITGAYTVLEPTDQSTARYLYRYYLALDQKKALKPAYTGLRNTIQKSRFMALKAPLPPRAERLAIVDHIDHETFRIDTLVSRHKREIELMQEYRTRLISDVVTGKLDVRGVELPPVETVVGEEIEATMDDEVAGELEEVLEEMEA